jgi:tyrosine-protein kinase Etk/Wzc
MYNKPLKKINGREAKGDDDNIDFKYIFRNYLSYWPLFIICLTVALLAACVVYKMSKPVYDIETTMLMQDDSKDKPSDDKSALQELDLVNPPKIVENEMEVFKSRTLVKSVVEHLALWVNYQIKDNFIKVDLYGASPINFILFQRKGTIPEQVLKVTIKDRDSYVITDENNLATTHQFKDTINDEMGKWAISSTDKIDSYIGKTVNVIISDVESTILSYQKSVNVDMPDKLASIIHLSISDQNPDRGKDFLNNLVYYYKQAELAEKNNITKSTIEFIDKRLDSLVGELNSAEGKVAGFRSSKGLTDINAQSQVYLQNVQSNDTRLNDVNIQLSVLRGLENYVNANTNDRNVPSTAGVSDPSLVALVQRLTDLQLEKTKLLATLPEKNPAFDPINRQIASTKLNVKESLKNIRSSLESTKNALQSFKSNSQSSISNIPGQERQLEGLKRQQSIKETLYTYLLQKREQISLSYASSLSNARLLDVAYALPLKQSKRYIPFGIALFLGFFIPIGFIYTKDLAKDVVNKRKEVEIGTGLPVISELSYIKLASPIVTDDVNKASGFPLVEQFRHLRTSLNILNNSFNQKGAVTIVTSSLTKEGKSFISGNLALSMAKSGKRTILLEMDIYKPKISNFFSLKKKNGLSEYLKGNIPKSDIIQNIPFSPNLDVIGSGAFVDDFSEQLDQNKFHDLINELKGIYDNIIIDTPPLHAINDANILAQFANITLFVVRHGYTPKSMLAYIRKLNNSGNLPNIQVVFNGLKEGRDGEGYKYENYYHQKVNKL